MVSAPARPPGLRAVSLDAAGTLVHPLEPVARTYAAFAQRHGGTASVDEVQAELPRAMAELKSLRTGDPHWRAYWAEVVARATGCKEAELVNELYEHFAHATAWRLADGAHECLGALRDAGLKIAVLSNWDERLRIILDELDVTALVDAVLVSAEIGAEKPDRRAFLAAWTGLGVKANEMLHIGDDASVDVEGARAAGCHAWQFGVDVPDFAAIARVLAP
jgi:REG-2-like HAD superfamily hydrolase